MKSKKPDRTARHLATGGCNHQRTPENFSYQWHSIPTVVTVMYPECVFAEIVATGYSKVMNIEPKENGARRVPGETPRRSIRISHDDWWTLTHAAVIRGVSISDFIRKAALSTAHDAIATTHD